MMAEHDAHPLPNTPWAIEADKIARETGIPYDYCRDLVTLRWLHEGDSRALASAFASGQVPSQAVLNYVAKMLAPELDPSGEVPFQLEPKARKSGKRGRRNNPENDIRDVLLFENVRRVLNEIGAGGYEAALSTMAAEMRIPRDTVKKAYDTRARAGTGTN